MEYKNDNSTIKKIIAVVIALVLIVSISAGTAFCISKRTVEKAQLNLTNTIKGDLGEYLAEYEGTRTGISGQLTGTEEDIVNLTDEQISAIVEAVSESIEYNLIKDMISTNSTVSEESLAALEKEMSEKISTIIESDSRTSALSESEKQSMVKTISSIVKSDMISVLSGYEGVSESDLSALKSSLESDLKSIETIITNYNNKFTDLEKSVSSVSASISAVSESANEDVENLTEKINNLTQQYNTLLVKYETITKDSLKVSSIVDNLNSTESTKVLSANMGHTLNEAITSNAATIKKNSEDIYNLLTSLTESAASMNKDLESLKNSTLASLSGIGINIETLSSDIDSNKDQIQKELENAIDVINDAMSTSDASTNATLEATKKALESQLANLDSATAQSLAATKNALTIADEALQAEIENKYKELTQSAATNADAILNLNNTLSALRESSQNQMNEIAQKVTAIESALGATGSSGTIADQLDDHSKQLTEISNYINYLQGGSDGNAIIGEYDDSTGTPTLTLKKSASKSTTP